MVDNDQRREFVGRFPGFANLTKSQMSELIALMKEVHFKANQAIVVENTIVDSIYIILEGKAEVSKSLSSKKKIIPVPIATLQAGEAIGLNDTGFYSTTGHRTATVKALTEMRLLVLKTDALYQFLQKHQLESSMRAATLQMERMRFIKQSLPFAKISPERLQWLAEHVEEITLPANHVIFNQGDIGDRCYLIRSGKVEIIAKDEIGKPRLLATLPEATLFGEATLLTNEPRNATAKTITACDLLTLRFEYLSELLESEANVANMFVTLMVDRSRPLQNSHVTIHQRTGVDGEEITILKNPDNGSYFKLSKEGLYIWDLLDGNHTMQDITLDLAENHHIFAPNLVAALISKLTQSNFIVNLPFSTEIKKTDTQPTWVKAVTTCRKYLEIRKAFGDVDKWITHLYEKYIWYFFTKPAQFVIAAIILLGLVAFAVNTPNVLLFFSFKHTSLFLLLALIPLSMLGAFLHEMGHAFTVKAFGREVHYIGVGWYWIMPIAFTDTSDMWLATRKSRMLVNLAGVYMDVLVAGIYASLSFVIENPYIQAMFWLFALYTYIGAFRMLSPLQEMDGYYVLMDWVEKNRLRQASVVWLIKIFPKSILHPHLFKQHIPEVIYWIACLLYLGCVTILTLVLQSFVFNILDIQTTNPYLTLLLPFAVVLFSCLSIIADIRNQTEE